MSPKLTSQGRTAVLAVIAIPLAWRGERIYRSLPVLPKTSHDTSLPSLSIIVPVRNEEENLKHLVPSLLALDYPGNVEIIIVNDNSSDRSAQVAADYGVKLVQAAEPTGNSLGKPNASHTGALASSGEWLLFTDADTVHSPEGAALAVSYALSNQLDCLSLFLYQEFFSPLDRLVMIAAFAGLFAGTPPRHSLLNGQFILIRREVYQESGGFLSVKDQSQDDLAFGALLRMEGYKVEMMVGNHAGRVKMYQDVGQIWRGLTRLGKGGLHWSGIWSLLTVIHITALMSPLLTITGVLNRRISFKWIPISWASVTLGTIPWGRRFGSGYWSLLTPIGAAFVLLAAVWGILSEIIGIKQTWKGRKI